MPGMHGDGLATGVPPFHTAQGACDPKKGAHTVVKLEYEKGPCCATAASSMARKPCRQGGGQGGGEPVSGRPVFPHVASAATAEKVQVQQQTLQRAGREAIETRLPAPPAHVAQASTLTHLGVDAVHKHPAGPGGVRWLSGL